MFLLLRISVSVFCGEGGSPIHFVMKHEQCLLRSIEISWVGNTILRLLRKTTNEKQQQATGRVCYS